MTTAYKLRCVDCGDETLFESVNNPGRLDRLWYARHKLSALSRALETLSDIGISLEGQLLFEGTLAIWPIDLEFLVTHSTHRVVVHDEYGRDTEIPC